MALRDQPYLPLYVQDYLTDEKLNECSASTQGIYIKIMCIMHKSEEYGCVLLEQKYKQTDNQINNFALKLVKHLPFSESEILNALRELIDEKVLHLFGDKIYQKRMVNDNVISLKRSEAGQKGGLSTQFAKANTQAKGKANTENEIEIDYNNEEDEKAIKENINREKFNKFRLLYPGIKRGNDTEYDNFIKKTKDWNLVIDNLLLSLKNQIKLRELKKAKKEFIPEWKNLQTWINQRCWEEIIDLSESNIHDSEKQKIYINPSSKILD